MTQRVEGLDVFVCDGKVDIPNVYSAGAVQSRFLIELRDNKRIVGMRCPACNVVYVPPRSTCKYCFGQLDEWTDVSDKGTLLTYTVVCRPNPVQPVEPPIVYGIVQLDGADTGLLHMIGEADFESLRVGMRVEAVYREERKGDILDIKHFRPLR